MGQSSLISLALAFTEILFVTRSVVKTLVLFFPAILLTISFKCIYLWLSLPLLLTSFALTLHQRTSRGVCVY